MISISILVPKSAVLEAVANPRYMFTAANHFLQAAGQPPLFDVHLVGEETEIAFNDGIYKVKTDQQLNEVINTNLVIIPALFGNMKEAIALNHSLIDWIKEQHQKGSEIASLCLGAFLLAATGLLDGKKCSTHWAYYNEFKTMFPKVEIADGSIITQDENLYTSGGANSYWNLMLYLLEKYTNRELAILAAKYFAIDIDRDSQAAFAIFNGQKLHKDEAIRQAQLFIEKYFSGKITVDQLAETACMNRRSFERRFKKATGNTVIEYLQRVKIEAAKRNFENNHKNISEVMMDVGYSDTKSFRTVFKKVTGLTPIEYRNKYSKWN